MIFVDETEPAQVTTWAPRLSAPLAIISCGVHIWTLPDAVYLYDTGDPPYAVVEPIDPDLPIPPYIIGHTCWLEHPYLSDTWYRTSVARIDDRIISVPPPPGMPVDSVLEIAMKVVKYWTDV